MAGQIDINRVQLAVRVDLDVAAAVRTVSQTDGVSMSRWQEGLIVAAVEDVMPNAESLCWVEKLKAKNVERRRKADLLTASGHFRKLGWEAVEEKRKQRNKIHG